MARLSKDLFDMLEFLDLWVSSLSPSLDLSACLCYSTLHWQCLTALVLLHHELWRYYQSTSKVRLVVMQNLVVSNPFSIPAAGCITPSAELT